jgi:uncharacterized protein
MRPDFIYALAGGALIGLASALLLLTNGRIAGISGILGGALMPKAADFGWRLTFLLGLLAGGALIFVMPQRFDMQGLPSLLWVAVAGVIVGFGTRLGSGCTSGHGVCGISRGSPRSIVATLTFILTGGLTVFVVRHVL